MLIFGGTVRNDTNRPLEVMLIVIMVYLAVSMSVSFVMNIYNNRMMKKEMA